MRPLHPKNKEEILAIAIPLFAGSGYNGVSMRTIAKNVGLSAAALYHHFPDKQTLYLSAMAKAFVDKADSLDKILSSSATPEKRLAQFITRLCELVHKDKDFSVLIQREMMDGNKSRLQLLATEIYHDLFQGVTELCQDLDPQHDPYLLAISIIGLVMYHSQTAAIRPYLLHSKKQHSDPQVIAQHVTQLVLQGLKTSPAE
ncbi:MAG: TetR/AcrR family transcriptional regulator [Thermodesulfobacteriota bacterium]|nr:TetR/AcrR family transcriptional regulator [Thermodesulfobacteriota bacterium]